MPDFLLELGCEEIPASYIAPALEGFKASLEKALEAEGLPFGRIVFTSTPRRLIWFVPGLPAEQPARQVEIAGPPARVAFDAQGKATRAAEGFARSQGVSMGDLVRKSTEKGDYLFALKTVPPRSTAQILSGILPGMVAAMVFPKSMYWRDPSFRFARPLRRILALLGDKVVPFEVNGVKSGRLTAGHPFLAAGAIEIERADLKLLEDSLKTSLVVADRAERRAEILKQVQTALAAHGSQLREYDLLEEVTDLVEWPEILEGSFSPEYLVLPEEVVTAAMMEHQRYFPVRDSQGRLVNRFLAIANRRREDAGRIREGNERVLAARLSDAGFFWASDLKEPLEKVAQGLVNVMYLAGLGTMADKVGRMKEVVAWAADAAGLAAHKADAVEAASLSKADLLTQMVFEFPSLQGVMGRVYALEQGKPPDVAAAIAQHYLPRTLSGELPATATGRLVALADKADTLAGAFITGLIPSGSQDPYGLRRASVGIARIIIDGRMRISLEGLLKRAWDLASGSAKSQPKIRFGDLISFVRERIYQYYIDRGVRHDILRACLAPGFDDVLDFSIRLEAVCRLSTQSWWPGLVTAVERTFNITRNYTGPDAIDASLFAESEERALYKVLMEHAANMRPPAAATVEDYVAASQAYVRVLGEPLHVFFDKVFVNVDDQAVRNNRLALIRVINHLYSRRIADLAQIVQERQP